ncbi:MAG: flagellar protein FliS [Butyrivibrio sp.]|nr:flagellar protein FliS [Butyrivibrio sp.]
MTFEKKQEYTLKISQANKTQMITIIYEMIMDYLEEAMDEISIGKKAEGTRSLMKAQNCIDELLHSLNLKYELARNLREIYMFSKKELLVAGATYSLYRIWRVLKNFRSLHEAYVQLEKEDDSKQIMGNTQKVYAGLTYGRYSLNEDVTAYGMNRGLMA